MWCLFSSSSPSCTFFIIYANTFAAGLDDRRVLGPFWLLGRFLSAEWFVIEIEKSNCGSVKLTLSCSRAVVLSLRSVCNFVAAQPLLWSLSTYPLAMLLTGERLGKHTAAFLSPILLSLCYKLPLWVLQSYRRDEGAGRGAATSVIVRRRLSARALGWRACVRK
jgi:hypothetical protein